MDFVLEDRAPESPLLEAFWRTQSSMAGSFISQAATSWEMVIWRYQGENHVTVRGPETRAVVTNCPANAEFFGVRFKTGTYMPHLPIEKMVNGDILLPEAGKKSFWLNGSVWERPTFDNADIFIQRMVRQGLLVSDPVVEAVLANRPLKISPRALQYHFVQATGITQSTFHQIQRAHKAAEMLRNGASILNAAFENGYYDQAHLTRSLKRFVGQTPRQIAPISVKI